MPLVEYPDSESSDSHPLDLAPKAVLDTPARHPHKRKRAEDQTSELPPLPSSFRDLYASTTRTSTQDDPSLHDGRQRQTPHVEGNWPTHVYVEWYPTKEESHRISQTLLRIQNLNSFEKQSVHSLHQSDLGVDLPLHISLSRSLALTTDQRRPFLDAIEQGIIESRVAPFELTVTGIKWVSNYEGNRWFLVLQLGRPEHDGLNRLLRLSNTVAESCGQPPLYAKPQQIRGGKHVETRRKRVLRTTDGKKVDSIIPDPRTADDLSAYFHISIGWTIDNPEGRMKQGLEDLKRGDFGFGISVTAVKVKIGNAVTSVSLAVTEKGLPDTGIL